MEINYILLDLIHKSCMLKVEKNFMYLTKSLFNKKSRTKNVRDYKETMSYRLTAFYVYCM